MCATCGCGDLDLAGPGPGGSRRSAGPAGHLPGHHTHPDGTGTRPAGRTIVLRQKVLARNEAIAGDNRSWLTRRGVLAVNLMSSPGAGKTTLLERTVRELGSRTGVCVIEGDQETALDAARIEQAGARVVQINTGAGCHLDAGTVARALRTLGPAPGSVVFIENVGNLVCPALFDLGEQARVVIGSVTEGADKPRKYPQMFRTADLVLLNKTDLLRYLEFDSDRYRADLSGLNPPAVLLPVSASTGDGLAAWYDWLRDRVTAATDR